MALKKSPHSIRANGSELPKSWAVQVEIEAHVSQQSTLIKKPRSKLLAQYWLMQLEAKGMSGVSKKLSKALGAINPSAAHRLGHDKEWTKYVKGKQVPQPSLVSLIEPVVPGSMRLRNHVIWDICKLTPQMAAEMADELLEQLDTKARHRLFRPGKVAPARKRVSAQLFRYLEERDDLDGLAALSLLVLESSGLGKDGLAIRAGESLFRATLRLPFSAERHLAKVAADLFELFRAQIFPYARSERQRLATDRVDYVKLIQLVELVMDHLQSRVRVAGTDILRRVYCGGWTTPVGTLFFNAPLDDNYPGLTKVSATSSGNDWPKEWILALEEWLAQKEGEITA